MKYSDIKDTMAESGVIATVVQNPQFIFFCEYLRPNHFAEPSNAFIYYAVTVLAKKGVEKIDAYGILNVLNAKESTKSIVGDGDGLLGIEALTELIDLSPSIMRTTEEEYKMLVDIVVDNAFKRDLYQTLKRLEQDCFSTETTNLKTDVYNCIDKLVANYYISEDVQEFGNLIDDMWSEIEEAQEQGGTTGYSSKIPALNDYFTYDIGELRVVAGQPKSGKSTYCMNELVDKLRQGATVVYFDSEMTDKQQFTRLLSHLTGIAENDIKKRNYNEEDAKRLMEARSWLKRQKYYHYNMTELDKEKIYLVTKRLLNTVGLDFVIVDYIKSQGTISSSEAYNLLGEYTDFLKNKIAVGLKLPVLAAAQLNRSGEISDSYKIQMFASTIIKLVRKTREEIARDGEACGNFKLFITANRNGGAMDDITTEYIDLKFDSSSLSFEQAKQHEIETPY